ncbi:threonine ammonia-lyase [Kiloniella laminariae]|uniref:threonine ammonia-lyase n=1 Tax=Kiloniella laminariae TaxID=454162 RepID=UPI000375B834|nr:threonine/serine dehydratase [Kiloniella laminariae]
MHQNMLPGFSDVLEASERLKGKAVRTPLLENAELNRITGGRILIKPEVLQHTGSFKFRGAYNFISQLDETAQKSGLVAYSSGNHAQGVAYSAQLFGIKSTIIMPKDAPQIKIDNTRAFGAEVILYDRFRDSREDIGNKVLQETGAIFVPPYDHRNIIAGQGTCGLEIAQQVAELDLELDAAIVCCGGGGFVSGVGLALNELSPFTKIYSAEPENFDDMAKSLTAARRIENSPEARSICDAILTPTPGKLTFQLSLGFLDRGLCVSDMEVRAAMTYAFRTLKLVVEPGGAVALASVLSNKLETKGKTIALTLSGGNVDTETFKKLLLA